MFEVECLCLLVFWELVLNLSRQINPPGNAVAPGKLVAKGQSNAEPFDMLSTDDKC